MNQKNSTQKAKNMQNQKHSYSLLIREFHLDTFGHVNNATYLQILEEARWELITSQGYGLDYIKKTGLGPTILEINIKFKRELKLRQKILIETELLSYEKIVAVMAHTIKNESDQICCQAEIKFGLFDVHKRKLVSPTPEWLRAIGANMIDKPKTQA
jgi:thioesterase III